MKDFTDSMQNESPSMLNSESSAGLEPLDPPHRHHTRADELADRGWQSAIAVDRREGGKEPVGSGVSADNSISNKIG